LRPNQRLVIAGVRQKTRRGEPAGLLVFGAAVAIQIRGLSMVAPSR
jgi:hypothetical protein